MYTPKSHSWFFYLCAVEGAAAIAALLSIPSEGGSLSFARLALIGFLTAICAVWVYLGRQGHVRARVEEYTMDRGAVSLTACLVAALLLGLLLFLLRYSNPERFLSIYQRLSPLLWYLLILALQFSLALLVRSRGFHADSLVAHKPVYAAALVALGLLLGVALLVSLTRLGLTPDPAYWGEPGVPILGWQFALALLGGLAVLVLALSIPARSEQVLDLLLPAVIYLLAVTVWLSVPITVLKNSFYMPIDPQTSQPFPYSDAGYYDQMAQSLLIGHPYQGQIPTRPLYIVLLTVLHLLFGEDYRAIVTGQTFVLAIIPVVFYLLGKKLHSRAAGAIVALFFIFRELTALLVSSDTRVSNTKTLLVDLPTLLLLILACYLTFRWLEHGDRRSALIAGGTFGCLLLLRTQSVLVLPLALFTALLVFGWKDRRIYRLTSFFLLGFLAAIAPWLLHNYLQTGKLTLEATFQYATVASQYAYTGNNDLNNFDFAGKSVSQILIEFALRDPGFVLGFISNHFLATQVGSLFALPLFKTYNGLFAPVNLYWMNGAGDLEWYNGILLLVYLVVMALGLGAAWKRWRWIGLLPLAFSAGYALATAVGRFSGWRYDLPADWIAYFYFGVGFAELLLQAASALGYGPRSERRESPPPAHTQPAPAPAGRRRELVLWTVLFAFLGALPWMAENIAAPRYPDQSREFLEREMVSIADAATRDQIRLLLAQPDALMQTGRVTYPRFFRKDDGLASTNPWASYAIRDYPRLGFLLLNQASTPVVFPTKRLADFPHAADAIVLGCKRSDHLEARIVAFPALDTVYLSEPFVGSCSASP